MRMFALVCLVTLSAIAAPPAKPAPPTDRPHDLASKASQQTAKQCVNIHDAAHCHQLPAGCETKSNPGYDAYLAFFKNQTISPKDADLQIKHTFTKLADIAALDAKTQSFAKSHQAGHATQLASFHEGEIDAVVGYLYYAEQTGSEACNCDLTQPADTDIHIGIGFDPAIAAKIANNTFHFNPDPKGTDDAKRASMVVEMTPHYRAQFHPHWTQPSIAALHGRQVKVVGQLLVDSDHNENKQDCAFPNAIKASCWRASVWEIHPVTRLYVCKAGATCSATSTTNWEEVP